MKRLPRNFQPSSSYGKFQAIFTSLNRYFIENSHWVPRVPDERLALKFSLLHRMAIILSQENTTRKKEKAQQELIRLTNKPLQDAFMCSSGVHQFATAVRACCKLMNPRVINSYLVIYIFLFSFLHFSITALLQLGVTTANYAGMIDFLQPRPRNETTAESW